MGGSTAVLVAGNAGPALAWVLAGLADVDRIEFEGDESRNQQSEPDIVTETATFIFASRRSVKCGHM